MKKCTKCGDEKVLTEFSPSTTHSDSRRSWCKRCCNELASRRWHESEEVRQRSKDHNKKLKAGWARELENIFGSPTCGICGTELNWFSPMEERHMSVHWDHRHGEDGIQHPCDFFRKKYSPTDMERFVELDYGMLCHSCNRFLTSNTNRRKDIAAYILGGDHEQ